MRDKPGFLLAFGRQPEEASTIISELIPITIRMSTPLTLAGLGGIFSERSGVVNIALEGIMLMSAFGYVIGTGASDSTWIGLIIGICWGTVIALNSRNSVHFISSESDR